MVEIYLLVVLLMTRFVVVLTFKLCSMSTEKKKNEQRRFLKIQKKYTTPNTLKFIHREQNCREKLPSRSIIVFVVYRIR